MYNKIESKNGIIGFAVGDAMGVTVEFIERKKLKENPVTEMKEFESHNMPKGSWSDDTSMTLATMDAIISEEIRIDTPLSYDGINCTTIANNFIDWLTNAKYTSTGRTFGVGNICLRALSKYHENKIRAEEAGCKGEMDNGNGSLMRMVPLIYYCYAHDIRDEYVYHIVKKVSSITHAHEVSILGCYIYVLFGIGLLRGWGIEQTYEYIQTIWFERFFSKDVIERYSRIIYKNIKDEEEDNISSAGYVVSTLEATLWTLLNTDSYDSAIIKAINLGDDADTVAGCVGGLAGIHYGIDSINENWKKDLQRYQYIEDMCTTFDEVLNEVNKKVTMKYNSERPDLFNKRVEWYKKYFPKEEKKETKPRIMYE